MKVYHMAPGLMTRGRLNRNRTIDETVTDLLELGVTLVVTLTAEGEPALMRPLARAAWLTVAHYPVSDARKTFKNEDWYIRDIIRRVVEEIHGGGSALVMCRAGQNRAQLIAAGVLAEIEPYYNGRDALAHVRDVRSNALTNERFVEWLEKEYP
jgi:hypothetical protein